MPKRSNTAAGEDGNGTTLHYFSFSSDVLMKCCPLPKEMIHHVNLKTNTLTIEASQSMRLSEYLKKTKKHMEYRDMEKMIQMIGTQLQQMEEMDKGIPSFNLDDISVFYTRSISNKNDSDDSDDSDDFDDSDDSDDSPIVVDRSDHSSKYTNGLYFAITNDDKVCDFDDTTQQLNIITPYKSDYTTIPATGGTSSAHKRGNRAFISPEFEKFISTKTLPYSIHFKSGYYSFGLLCAYCFVSKTITSRFTSTLEQHAALASIINTKIYWFLLRLLHENPSMRRYICL
jgi:hypothetical protein